MSRRLDIPWLVDLLLVDDPELMSRLNQHPKVVRRLVPSHRWLNELLRKHIDKHMRVGETPLPVFVDQEPPSTRLRQRELAAHFDALAADGLRAHAEDKRLLAQCVAGGPETEIGVVVQRIVGSMFRPDYTANSESYRAALTVAAGTQLLNVLKESTPLRGRLARAIYRLSAHANDDTHCIHGTAIAMHNVVSTIENMRKGFARGEADRHATAADAVRGYLHVPQSLLRSCSGDAQVPGLSRPLRAGTMVVFQLARAVASSGDVGRAFARGEWNECPASRATLTLLEEVWEDARRARVKSAPVGAGTS